MKLEDKVAVITGGSKGIGLGCARVFARHGGTVVLGARGEEAGREAE
ncbi:MAG: SDR family NAD(P)-dependent oxidoreductase, partial [Candidatus Latescibacteria bacterium]|nr:SDR family NAD(P)-dependent oxidoreductase [Candidatus Latescibacterota bacterium]